MQLISTVASYYGMISDRSVFITILILMTQLLSQLFWVYRRSK